MQLFSRLEIHQRQKFLPFEVRFFVGLGQFIKFSIKKARQKKTFEVIRFIRLNPTVFQIRNENKQFIFSNPSLYEWLILCIISILIKMVLKLRYFPEKYLL